MKKITLLILLVCFGLVLRPQVPKEQATYSKNGWVVYYNDHAIWFEDDGAQRVNEKQFFLKKKHPNGLIIDYLPQSEIYKSVAEKYRIEVYFLDTLTKREGYTSKDSLLILPAKAKLKTSSKSVSDLLTPMGLSFKQRSNEVTLQYNFETNYDITEIELVRKKDKKRIKKTKDRMVSSKLNNNPPFFVGVPRTKDQ